MIEGAGMARNPMKVMRLPQGLVAFPERSKTQEF
jgi:hypothetical protein